MDDSMINPILLSSSAHLENVEQLIKNLEKQTVHMDDLEDILSNRRRQELITKSFSSSTMAVDDDFLLRSITVNNDGNFSMDSLFNQRDLFENNQVKKQQAPANEQSLLIDQDGGFTWDDQYDTRANYRLTFSTDRPQQMDSKPEKSRRHQHRSTDRKMNSIYSNDVATSNVSNSMNDWSMRSSCNALEQSMEQPQITYIRSQQQVPANNSPESSSSSSTSWRRMRGSHRTTSGTEIKESRPPSPFSLYKIFQQKSSMGASSPRSAFQLYRQQNDSIVPNYTDEMTISGEKLTTEKSKLSHYQKDRSLTQSHSSTDQAIQTSILLDSSSNSNINQMNSQYKNASTTASKSESYDRLTVPSTLSSIHKSLPDLSFISQYSKVLPRSLTASHVPPTSSTSIIAARRTPSPTLIQQQKQDSERPRTLKSIKRYKNSKHSTEPLGVFYSPQLRKTFAAVPASAVITGSDTPPIMIKMKLSLSSSPQPEQQQQQQQQQTSNLKSCLKQGSRANSCDIQAMLQDTISPVPSLLIPEPASNKDSTSPSSKRRCSEVNVLKPPVNFWSSDNLNNYILPDFSREHRSEHDLTLIFQQNPTKKSVSFSENISQHLISPCNPTIIFNDQTMLNEINNDLAMVLHGNKERLGKRTPRRYGEMRRCQTDIIVVDPVLHLQSFTDSPPNEFRLRETDSISPDEDDQSLMNKSHVNIIHNLHESVLITDTTSSFLNPTTTVSNEKENNKLNQSSTKIATSGDPLISNSLHMNTSTIILEQSLDYLLERSNDVIKRLFEIKRSDKAFFLNNEHNTQLDSLLKNDLCTIIQNILEHGLKPQRKDLPLTKRITLWKIIETSIDHRPVPQAYYEAKHIAQNISSHWLYKFQSFIFVLLNKSELINWLYYFTRQKDIIQRYYQSPDALILVAISSTFNLFERIMTQLEKLTPLAFRLTYHISTNEEQLHASMISTHSGKTSARDWVMTMSRRSSKNVTQPITNDTFRSTLSRKFNALFTKTDALQQRKPSSAVTAKLPESKQQILQSKSPGLSRRPRLSNVFSNATAAAAINKPVIVSSLKLNHENRTGSIRRGISPSLVVAPSPPPAVNITGTNVLFQSKIPRPSLNVDKPKSARYRSTAPPPPPK